MASGGLRIRAWPGLEGLPALALVGVVALLVLPIPPLLMDGLLTINLAFAVVLLLTAFRVGEVLALASFPALLLCSTLLRLALNISTTRLILLQADAGAVVEAFGRFVVAGNPLVGGVVFLILTVVQFVVISKGAERVAEVTARFALDGLPGKQMSIDADLRAGAIDQAAAAERRLAVEREAQFHGAMDGAMKFVKGDAIAGIAITLVNLVGGLLVGCVQHGLGADEAVARYSVLTIGDGLVSQVPALLVSTAAGLVVTRVRSDRAGGDLGRQIAAQLGAHPEVFLFTGGVLLAVGLVPGMPLLAFSVPALAALAFGVVRLRRLSRGARTPPSSDPPGGCQVVLSVAAELAGAGSLAPRLEALRQRVGDDLGFDLPPITRRDNAPAGRWSLLVDDAPVAGGARRGDEERWLAEVEEGLRLGAARILGVQETQDLLDRLERGQPALVREVVPRLVPPVLLAEILARLVEEGVPIRNLRHILACLAEWARSEADPMVLAERVRESQRSIITRRLAPEGVLSALVLDPEVEAALLAGLSSGPGGTALALAPERVEAMLAGLGRALAAAEKDARAVVLTRPEVRRPFWRLVQAVFPRVAVVSFLELEPTVEVRPVARVSLAASAGGGR